MAIHSLMMASLAAEDRCCSSTTPRCLTTATSEISPNATATKPPQVHCDRYDDVVDLITQVELIEKFKFSHYTDLAPFSLIALLPSKHTKTLQKHGIFATEKRAQKTGGDTCRVLRQACCKIRQPNKRTRNPARKRGILKSLADRNSCSWAGEAPRRA